MRALSIILFLSSVFVVTARAGIGGWDFDSGTTQSYLYMQCGEGILTRGLSGAFELTSGQGRPLEWGSFSVSPFNSTGNVPYYLNFTAELPTSFQVEMGDDGTDNDILQLRAYSGPNGTGDLLDTETQTLTFGSGFYRTLRVEAAGIRSVVFIGGVGNNSVFYDNLRTTCVPNGMVYSNHLTPAPFPDFSVFRPNNGNWYTYY